MSDTSQPQSDALAQAEADLARAQAEIAAAAVPVEAAVEPQSEPASASGAEPAAEAVPAPAAPVEEAPESHAEEATVHLVTLWGRTYQPYPDLPAVTPDGVDVPATVAERILAAAQAAGYEQIRKVDR